MGKITTRLVVVYSILLVWGCSDGIGLNAVTEETCGDGIIQSGEACDGANLGIATCELLGQGPGTPSCSVDCLTIEQTGCAEPRCGDGIVNGDEVCDGEALGALSCSGVGFEAGAITCSDSCELEVTACYNPSQCACPAEWHGDGICDADCNGPDCEWDRGDCCASTCSSDASFECGSSGYDCQDPNACENNGECDPPPTEIPDENGCVAQWLQDGYCDEANNNATCGHDGGDCCPSTCLPEQEFACGVAGWDCIDPLACENTGECAPVPTCMDNWLGDGWCDEQNNIEACGFDDGDCCASTCQPDLVYACGDEPYDCLDPNACENLGNCEDSNPCDELLMGDGICDSGNNNDSCTYDSGDCCPSTCPETAAELCGTQGWACIDPNACETTGACDPAPPCIPNWTADGWCDNANNVETCGWDGGDCCSSTCDMTSDYGCAGSPFDCQDPEACENRSTGCF
ncbi:MAG: hypothetical protein VX834_08815 [Myxococcota bacterium]|nr:hypothetical protein [Myxococcota bacterium]